MSMSATPSSSISRSSIQLFLVRALHFKSHAAYTLKTPHSSYLVIRILLEHLSAYLDAVIKPLPIEPTHGKEERVHIELYTLNSNFIIDH